MPVQLIPLEEYSQITEALVEEGKSTTTPNSSPNKSFYSRFQFWFDTREFYLTFLTVLWFFSCTYVVCLANAYLDTANPSLKLPLDKRTRLPDPLLDFTYPIYKFLDFAPDFADYMVKIAPAFTFIRCAMMERRTLLVFRRCLFTLGTGYLFRTPFVLMTILPNPLVTCVSNPHPNLMYDAYLLFSQARSSCGDVLYSGHTIMFLVTALVWTDYPLSAVNSALSHTFAALMGIFTFLGIFLLIASSYHYTVDCVVGVLVVLFIWKFYHFVVTTNYCDGTWYSKFLLYLDGERQILNPKSQDYDFSVSYNRQL